MRDTAYITFQFADHKYVATVRTAVQMLEYIDREDREFEITEINIPETDNEALKAQFDFIRMCAFAYTAEGKAAEQRTKERNARIAAQPLSERLEEGFVSCPGDVLEVLHHTSKHCTCICDTITLRLTNGDNVSTACVRNCKAAWKMLKNVSEIGAREVWYTTLTRDNGEEEELSRIPFNQSAPYTYRFGRA